MRKRQDRKRSQGFTLVELLAVIAVVTLLAAMLFPAVSKAQYRARFARCQSNLHQIWIAYGAYVLDNHAYPTGCFEVPPQATKLWYHRLNLPLSMAEQPESGSGFYFTGIWQCPFQKAVRRETTAGFEWLEVKLLPFTSYGCNLLGSGSATEGLGLGGKADKLTGAWRALEDSAVVNPAEMTTLGDAFSRSIHTDGVQNHFSGLFGPWTMATKKAGDWAKQEPTFKDHRGKFNRAFLDGHIETEDLNSRFVRIENYMRRWNYDNQPHVKEWAEK